MSNQSNQCPKCGKRTDSVRCMCRRCQCGKETSQETAQRSREVLRPDPKRDQEVL